MTTENDLAEQMEQMNIQNPVESIGAWDAIYNYMYPELKREYDMTEMMYQVVSSGGGLFPDEQQREINRFRNEMANILQVRHLLRRMAGYRH